MSNHQHFLNLALKLAAENARNGTGGPFGAVIVRDGKIIGTGANQVTTSNDPTAHAEIQAIRHTCHTLSTFQLQDCILYTSSEPCPMCMSAIYWARIKEVYYYHNRTRASAIGFDDDFIYHEIPKSPGERSISAKQVSFSISAEEDPFYLWKTNPNVVHY
ncbi:nucleoside deaminase [Bacillus songklensis]|uniref:Nucleoside deaminase n=1 Tax=Bacillus songklensis TaxID=1069116 RepID=A0ABV8B0N0_9BACI